MHADCVPYCPLVSRVEYAPRALLRLAKKTGQTDGQMEGHQIVTLRVPLDASSVITRQTVTDFNNEPESPTCSPPGILKRDCAFLIYLQTGCVTAT